MDAKEIEVLWGFVQGRKVKDIAITKKAMKFSDVILWVILLILWSLFILWQLEIEKLSPALQKDLDRYDLYMLPIFVLVSIYVVRHLVQKKN